MQPTAARSVEKRHTRGSSRLSWNVKYLKPAKKPLVDLAVIQAGAGQGYLLAQDLRTTLAAKLRNRPELVIDPEAQLAAIVDFTFNLGGGGCELGR